MSEEDFRKETIYEIKKLKLKVKFLFGLFVTTSIVAILSISLILIYILI